jgi:voltage-gated potassium channel
MKGNSSSNSLRSRLHEIIFEADTPAGKLFDILLILSIVASISWLSAYCGSCVSSGF